MESVHGYIHWFSSAHQAPLISQGNGTRTHKTTVTIAGAAGVDGENRQHVNQEMVGKPQSVGPWKRNVVMRKLSLQSETEFTWYGSE